MDLQSQNTQNCIHLVLSAPNEYYQEERNKWKKQTLGKGLYSEVTHLTRNNYFTIEFNNYNAVLRSTACLDFGIEYKFNFLKSAKNRRKLT